MGSRCVRYSQGGTPCPELQGARGTGQPPGVTREGAGELPRDPQIVKPPGGWTLSVRLNTLEDLRAGLLALVAQLGVQQDAWAVRPQASGFDRVQGQLPARATFQHPGRHLPGEYAITDEKCRALRDAGLVADDCKYAMFDHTGEEGRRGDVWTPASARTRGSSIMTSLPTAIGGVVSADRQFVLLQQVRLSGGAQPASAAFVGLLHDGLLVAA
jgi:hypothetical protein